MSKFSDAMGLDWRLEFDGFLLDRIEKEAKVDLADLSAGGLLAVERDVKALVRVLAVACDEQLKARGKTAVEFQKQIRKDAITRAREAVLEALADFFPASEWSAIQSTLTTRKGTAAQMGQMMEVAPAFAVLPEAIKVQLFQEEIGRRGSLALSPGIMSASVPVAEPPTPADDSPESAELAPGDSPSETSG